MADDSVREQQLQRAIESFLTAEADSPELREQLVRAHPSVADSLWAFFSDHDQLEQHNPALTLPTQGSPGGERPSADSGAPQIPGYTLIREVARGGMGVVYQAQQDNPNRVVAIKMILAGHLACPEDVARFEAEAHAAAKLDHRGIVPIYEVGQHQDQHYFSMGYVDGPTLAHRLNSGPLPAREAASLVADLAEAIDYAHRQGVIHRDLKPANVLLDEAGRSRITDFGLAQRVEGDHDLTATGQVLGTPSYMPPEQAAGDISHIDQRSDIYSLGALLYEMLTGRPPFRAETPLDTIIQVLDNEPVPPRLLNANVPRDLQVICLKCLQKDPNLRYTAAHELQDDLQRFLDGETIRATSINLIDRVTRAIGQSRHQEKLQGWGKALMLLGITICCAHGTMFVLEWLEFGRLISYWLPRTAMYLALLALLVWFRPHRLLPTNSAERLIWVVWTGFILALLSVNVAIYLGQLPQQSVFAFSAILSGLGFFVMGGHVWGGCYLVGLTYWIAAPLLIVFPQIAPLGLGLLWAVALCAIGSHYWTQGRD